MNVYLSLLVDIRTYCISSHTQTNLYLPDDVEVSEEAKDLLKKLICSADKRIGKSGIDEIKNHPFFRGIKWDNVRDLPPPYIPEISGDTDTSNFDEFEPSRPGVSEPLAAFLYLTICLCSIQTCIHTVHVGCTYVCTYVR